MIIGEQKAYNLESDPPRIWFDYFDILIGALNHMRETFEYRAADIGT